jgi:hypothetical protein
MSVFDPDDHVVEHRSEFVGEPVDGGLYQPLEAVPGEGFHRR